MTKFPNLMGAQFAGEITEANDAAAASGGGEIGTGTGPYMAMYDGRATKKWVQSNGFRTFVQNGAKFKWVLNQRGDLGVISPTLKHSIAAGGGDVWTAGHGSYDSGSNTMNLDNDTGHYQTSEESLERSREAWETLGYKVHFQAFRDLKAALGGLF